MMYLIIRNLDNDDKSREESVVATIQAAVATIGLKELTVSDNFGLLKTEKNFIYILYEKSSCLVINVCIGGVLSRQKGCELTELNLSRKLSFALSDSVSRNKKGLDGLNLLIEDKHFFPGVILLLPYGFKDRKSKTPDTIELTVVTKHFRATYSVSTGKAYKEIMLHYSNLLTNEFSLDLGIKTFKIVPSGISYDFAFYTDTPNSIRFMLEVVTTTGTSEDGSLTSIWFEPGRLLFDIGESNGESYLVGEYYPGRVLPGETTYKMFAEGFVNFAIRVRNHIVTEANILDNVKKQLLDILDMEIERVKGFNNL